MFLTAFDFKFYKKTNSLKLKNVKKYKLWHCTVEKMSFVSRGQETSVPFKTYLKLNVTKPSTFITVVNTLSRDKITIFIPWFGWE